MKNINEMTMNTILRNILITLVFVCLTAGAALAQTSSFTHQGKLTDGGVAANGTYDITFKLYDTLANGTQVGLDEVRDDVTVSDGVFTVNLDFGASSFANGGPRYLQIEVRPGASSGTFTTLAPRQPITSSPYAVKSINSANADVATNSTQLGGVAANQYLQTNGNGSALTNLNAASITTGTLSNARLGQIPTANIADSAVTAPKIASGQVVKSINTLTDNVTLAAGTNITLTPAGSMLTIASTSGGVGGSGTTSTIPLWSAGTTIGNSLITQSGGTTVQLPGFVSLAATPSGNNVSFGSPNAETGMTISGANGRADLRFNGSLKLVVTGPGGIPPATNGIEITQLGDVKIGQNLIALGPTEIRNSLFLTSLSAGTGTALCINANLVVIFCGSSLRYKTNIASFGFGLNVVNQLRPISFDWKEGGMKDVGFGAEDVAKIDPRFVTYNAHGEVEGVKYDRLSVVFVNAFKEQQAQIETLRAANTALNARLRAIEKVLQKKAGAHHRRR